MSLLRRRAALQDTRTWRADVDDEIPTGDEFLERFYTPELLGPGE